MAIFFVRLSTFILSFILRFLLPFARLCDFRGSCNLRNIRIIILLQLQDICVFFILHIYMRKHLRLRTQNAQKTYNGSSFAGSGGPLN